MDKKELSDARKAFGACIKTSFQNPQYKEIKPHKLRFCIFAKMCKGKFSKVEDAEKDCLSKHPEWR